MNNQLRELRTRQGWSQAELATRLEVSRQTAVSYTHLTLPTKA